MSFIDDPDIWVSWSLGRVGAHLILEALERRRPAVVLEAGSGVSTSVLADYAFRREAHVISLEHSRVYFDSTHAQLVNRELRDQVDLRLVSLIDYTTPIGMAQWYDTSSLPDGIDFVLVDGPPGHVSNGRVGALTALWPKLAPDFELWLDDAGRARERRALPVWQDYYGVDIELFNAGNMKKMARVTRG